MKWLCTVTCILLVAAFIASSGREITWVSPAQRYEVSLSLGSVSLQWPSAVWEHGKGHYGKSPGWRVSRVPWSWCPGWWFDWGGGAYYDNARIPLWMPFTLCGISGAVLWYKDRRDTWKALNGFMRWLGPRSRGGTGRIVRWGLTTATLVLLLAFVASLPWTLLLRWPAQTLFVESGQVSWGNCDCELDTAPLAKVEGQALSAEIHGNEDWQSRWSISITRSGLGGRLLFVCIPLWLPLLLIGVPAALLWGTAYWPHRELGRCPECGYDLTGNVSGRCPECGKAVRSATPEPSSPPAVR